MDDPLPNSDDPTVVPDIKAKKKKGPQGTKKSRSELTPEDIAKLGAESAKRRNRRVEAKRKDAAAAYALELATVEAPRQKADAQEKEDIISKVHILLMMEVCPSDELRGCVRRAGEHMFPSAKVPSPDLGGRPSVEMQRKQARPPSTTTMPSPRVMFSEMPTPTPTVEEIFYGQFMENVIFEGHGEAFQTGGQGRTFDPEEIQSKDGCGEYMADEDFEADYGDSWHEEDGICCEGDKEEENVVNIAGKPLFIDELTQRAEAQMRKKSIHTGSYTQDEDTLICGSRKEIDQDPRVDAQQKRIIFWTRVHKTFHERKLFPPYQFTSNSNINSIQKRWLFIQQECKKICAALESVEARPVSGLGIGDMAFQSLEAFKACHNNKPFTLTHYWQIINNCPKFKDQYRELQRKRDKKAVGRPHWPEVEMEVRDEKKRQGKEEQMKQYMKLQTKKLEMEETAKKRKIDMKKAATQRQLDIEEAARQRQLDIETTNGAARQRQLDIEATNAATKQRRWRWRS
ncbi:ABC transporter C family member 3 [Hordeum vulgare]|nr:ABC transporter C family member 3 [Hordeum vulgare]